MHYCSTRIPYMYCCRVMQPCVKTDVIWIVTFYLIFYPKTELGHSSRNRSQWPLQPSSQPLNQYSGSWVFPLRDTYFPFTAKGMPRHVAGKATSQPFAKFWKLGRPELDEKRFVLPEISEWSIDEQGCNIVGDWNTWLVCTVNVVWSSPNTCDTSCLYSNNELTKGALIIDKTQLWQIQILSQTTPHILGAYASP